MKGDQCDTDCGLTVSGCLIADPYWYKPSLLKLPYPPLAWLKPVTQQKILKKCDQEVAYCKERMDRLKTNGIPWKSERDEATENWRKAMIQRHWCRGDLGLN